MMPPASIISTAPSTVRIPACSSMGTASIDKCTTSPKRQPQHQQQKTAAVQSKPLVRSERSMFSEKKSFSIDTKPRLAHRHDSITLIDGDDEVHLESRAEQKPEKKVRFDTAGNGNPQTKRFEYPAIPQELIPELFWTRKESKAILKTQSRFAKKCVQESPEIIDSIYFLHGYSTAKSQQNMTTERAQAIVAASNCRGLERFMTSLMSKHRLWSMDQLLSIQDRCWEEEAERDDDSDREAEAANELELLLRVWSLKLSAAPNMYAVQVAQGDAKDAARGDVAAPASSGGLRKPARRGSFGPLSPPSPSSSSSTAQQQKSSSNSTL